ncbi:MAG: HD domain-containing protein [Chloroflexia bacterium]
MGVTYRLGQFLASVWALAFPPAEREAALLLSREEYALFRQMRPYDRAHALRVLRLLERQTVDRSLLRAALLHDLGKSAGGERIPLLYRGASVIARRFPKVWRCLARERPRGHPLRPFYLYAVHAARGARLAQAAGIPADVVALIAGHHDESATGALSLLQQADRCA